MKSKKFQQSFTKLINLWSHFATSRGLFQITSNRHYAIKILINSFLSICYFRKENTEAVHVEFICWIIFNCSRGKGTSTHTQASPGRSCGWCSNQSSITADWSNGSIYNVVDFVCFEGEYLTKSTPDLILKSHGFQSCSSIDVGIDVGSCNNNWVKVIVTKLSSLPLGIVSISKDSSIWIPFPHCWAVGHTCFFNGNILTASENLSVL